MLLVIDVGNTRVKYAVFMENTLLESRDSDIDIIQKLINAFLSDYPKISACIISSVGKLTEDDFSYIPENIKTHFVSHKSDFPFTNKYQTPETLGADRLVLASGATMRFPNQNRFVVDIGTAITYDFVDKDNNYLGGAISPGIALRYVVLNISTAKLPLLESRRGNFFIEQTTDSSIHSGVINGIVFEIEGFIERLQVEYDEFIIILTGGYANFFAEKLKSTIFAQPDFILESLNDLYQYQKNK